MIEQTQEERIDLVSRAKNILKGEQEPPGDILELANSLHRLDEFGWARKILDLAIKLGVEDDRVRQKISQKRALSTYKDTHLNREKALDLALGILGEEFDLTRIKDQETLGIAGAIFKRKWETDGIKVNLEQSLIYYERGMKCGIEGDNAYTAINAAYILDLLAHLEQKQAVELGAKSSVAAKRRKEAEKIRIQIIGYLSEKLKNIKYKQLGKQSYWPIVTLAEAYFGTKQYNEAGTWLQKARKIPDQPQWEYVATAKQLVHLAMLQADPKQSEDELEKTEAFNTLNEFLDGKAWALRSMHRGKVGLALSGGGFRASFYHIGVMARLAELDLLRHIEVLSCVSGGSILGTHYYLELRRLINDEKTTDAEVTREDYIRIINNIQDDFLAGVQKNPRVRLLASPLTNLKMIFAPHYSRTQRLGELYEKLIYSRVKDNGGNDDRWLNGLYMHPGGDKKFLPRRDNWALQCKVPELVINATSLNTGHNWQFTASWMGESPSQIDPDVDSNDRYRRTYYHEAPEAHRQIRLGTAVGASSCVPGLFEPIILHGLYEDTTVRLIDGGVYDNQGVASLIEQDCNVIISSDATGQMNTASDPGGGIVKPLLRTNVTLMQRVRNSQYQDLKARARSGILKGFAFVHLKQGVEGENIDWVNSDQADHPKPDANAKTDYGIRRDIQELLAGIRTDLDSFSDIEAYALMTSGYCAIEGPVKKYLTDFPMDQSARQDWKFLQVEAVMKQDKAEGDAFEKLKKNLEAGTMTFGKVWKLHRLLNLVKWAAAIVLLSVLVYIGFTNPDWKPFSSLLTGLGEMLTIGMIMWSIGFLVIVYVVTVALGSKQGEVVKQALNFRDLPRRIIVGAIIGLVGGIGAIIHLTFFDKMFKKMGRMD